MVLRKRKFRYGSQSSGYSDTIWPLILEGQCWIVFGLNQVRFPLLLFKISSTDLPPTIDVLTEPVNNDPVTEVHGSLPVVRRATALGNNDCFAGLSTALVDAVEMVIQQMQQQRVMQIIPDCFVGHSYTFCSTYMWDDRSGWCTAQWWDNNVYAAVAEVYNQAGLTPYPASVWGCLALLSNPDMSEAKGLAFTDMLEEFFTP